MSATGVFTGYGTPTSYVLLQRDAQGRCFGPLLARWQLIQHHGTLSLLNSEAA